MPSLPRRGGGALDTADPVAKGEIDIRKAIVIGLLIILGFMSAAGLFVTCFDAAKGKEFWSTLTPVMAPIIAGLFGMAAGSRKG